MRKQEPVKLYLKRLSCTREPLFLRCLGEWLSMVTSRDEQMTNGDAEDR